MILMEAHPISTPLDGELMIAQLWQLTSGRRFNLWAAGQDGEPVMLGVSCPNVNTERVLGDAVSRLVSAEGDKDAVDHAHSTMFPAFFETADEVAALNMHYVERNLQTNQKDTFGWQRYDPMKNVFTTLSKLKPGQMAGAAITLRSLPNERFMMSMTTIACGPDADQAAWDVAASFAGVGVQIRRPVMQRRAVQRTLDVKVRRPFAIVPISVSAKFWHPPYATYNLPNGPWPGM